MLETEKFKISEVWQLGSNRGEKRIDPGIDIHLRGIRGRTW